MRLAVVVDPSAGEGCAAEVVAVQVVKVTAALDRDEQAAEAVVADGGGRAAGDFLFIVVEEGVGRGRAAGRSAPRAVASKSGDQISRKFKAMNVITDGSRYPLAD